jgi:hypothetical protein
MFAMVLCVPNLSFFCESGTAWSRFLMQPKPIKTFFYTGFVCALRALSRVGDAFGMMPTHPTIKAHAAQASARGGAVKSSFRE